MLLEKLKGGIVEGSIYLIYKNLPQNSVFQPSENLHLDNFSPGPTMKGP